MRLSTTAAVVVVFAGPARGDMGRLPFERRVPVRVTLTADPPPPGVVLFIQDTGPLRRMPATSPLVYESPADGRGVGFSIYAVPEAVVASWPAGTPPPRDWFGRPDNPDWTFVGGGGGSGRVGFGDNRAVETLEYKLERTGDGMRVVSVSDNAPRWWQSGPCCLVVLSAPIGLIWLGVRLARSRPVRPS